MPDVITAPSAESRLDDVRTRDASAVATRGRVAGAPTGVLFDPTRGRETSAAYRFDPTRGHESNAAYLCDPTRGRESNASYRFDPTRGREIELSPLLSDLRAWEQAKGLSAQPA